MKLLLTVQYGEVTKDGMLNADEEWLLLNTESNNHVADPKGEVEEIIGQLKNNKYPDRNRRGTKNSGIYLQ